MPGGCGPGGQSSATQSGSQQVSCCNLNLGWCVHHNGAASSVACLSSLRNRPPQQSDSRPAQSSSGYRSDYEQYSQYQQQQQMYPGYYSSWGFDQTGYPYGCQLYDYSQYPAAQVGWAACGPQPGGQGWLPHHAALLTLSFFLGGRGRS